MHKDLKLLQLIRFEWNQNILLTKYLVFWIKFRDNK